MAEAPQVRVSPEGDVATRYDEDINGHGHWIRMRFTDRLTHLDVLNDEQVADWTPLVDVSPLIEEWQIAAADRRATSQHGQAKAYDECILNLRQLLEVDW